MIDPTTTSSRLLFTVERMTESTSIQESEVSNTTAIDIDNSMLLTMDSTMIITYPRVVGLTMLISSLWMISMAWKRRKFVFHRLVLAMFIHQLIYALSYLTGTFAIPSDYDAYFGNYGTIGTCTAQGFLIFVSVRCAMIYYGSFSVYSYVAVVNGFDRNKYQWCEKYIHIFCNAYPLALGVYFLSVEGFNPDFGFCAKESMPLGCEYAADIACERGPDSYNAIFSSIFLLLIPFMLMVCLPTIVMAVLYFKVKANEDREGAGRTFFITSRSIAMQSFVYLSATYLAVIPCIIIMIVRMYTKAKYESLFPYILAATINYAFFSLWSMLTYRHFSIVPKLKNNNEDKPNAITRKTDATDFIFDIGKGSSSRVLGNSICSKTQKTARELEKEEPRPKRQYSFNIFDGTNASGEFATFIHEGDSEDIRKDDAETEKWGAVQNHI